MKHMFWHKSSRFYSILYSEYNRHTPPRFHSSCDQTKTLLIPFGAFSREINKIHIFPYRELNPGHLGENQGS